MIIKPSLLLDFANSRQLPAGVTFSRASTATYYDALGVLRTAEINAPRFEHDLATGLCRGLLTEEARTNLLLNSGTLATQNATVTAVSHTLSFSGTGTITLSGASTAGPLVGTGANDRVTLTFTPGAGTLTLTVTGTVTNAQLETGVYATSYIPTAGTSVTRALDAAVMTGAAFSGWYRQDEGTFIVDAAMAVSTSDTVPRVVYGVGDSSVTFANGESIYLSRGSTSSNLGQTVLDGGVAQFSGGAVAVTHNASFRHAFAYKTNDFALCANGGTVVTDTSGTLPTPNTLSFGGLTQLWSGGSGAINGTVARLAYFPRRLTNAELQALTS